MNLARRRYNEPLEMYVVTRDEYDKAMVAQATLGGRGLGLSPGPCPPKYNFVSSSKTSAGSQTVLGIQQWQVGVRLVSDWCQIGVGLVSDWCWAGVGLVSGWCRTGVRMISVSERCPICVDYAGSKCTAMKHSIYT